MLSRCLQEWPENSLVVSGLRIFFEMAVEQNDGVDHFLCCAFCAAGDGMAFASNRIAFR